jgi:tetratricopeptide (TPR) repeat protein
MKKITLLLLLLSGLSLGLYSQKRAVNLSVESFYSDEGPLTSKEYNSKNFRDVFPGDPNGYLTRGVEKMEAGHLSESIKDFNESIGIAADCGVCYYYRGLNYLLVDSMISAKKDFQKAIFHDVMLIEAYNDLSSIYIQEGELDSAELVLEKGVGHYPAYLPTHFNLGYIKLLQGKEKKALGHFDKCLEMDSCNIESNSMKLLIYWWNNKIKDVEKTLDKMGQCDQGFAEVHLWNSVVKFQRGKLNEAIAEINNAIEIDSSYLPFILRAYLFVESERYDLAIQDFSRSYNLNMLENKKHQGGFLFRETQTYFQGLLFDYLGRKEQFDSEDVERIEKSICLLFNEEYGKAEFEIKRLIKKSKENDFFYLLMGMAKERLFDRKDALENYNKCIELNDKNIEAYKRRGLIYQSDGMLQAAMEDYTLMYEINSESSEALKYRGIAKMINNQYRSALADFDEYETKFEGDSDIFFNKGQCQNQLGLYEDAVVSYKKVLAVAPVDVEVIYKIAENSYVLGRREECIKMCDSILNNRKCYVMASNLKGIVQSELSQNEKALASFEYGLSCSPNYVDLLINKSIVLVSLNRSEEALLVVNQALFQAPNNGLAYLIRAQIKHNIGNATACDDLSSAIKLGMSISEAQRASICK